MFKGSSKLGLYGIIATIIYFLAIAYIILFTDYIEPKALTLNELGDFFAGVFGPPALIWVVISFYLQSEELKNSVSALKLQAEELAKSVEQQIAMVGLTRESMHHEQKKLGMDLEKRINDRQPVFTLQIGAISMTGAVVQYRMTIKNIGAPATQTNIKIIPELHNPRKINFSSSWDRSEEKSFDIYFVESGFPDREHHIEISYEDVEGDCNQQDFIIDATKSVDWTIVKVTKKK